MHSNQHPLIKKAIAIVLLLACIQNLSAQERFKVIAYCMPGMPIAEIPFQYLTHINYSFAIPSNSGDTLEPLNNIEYVKQLVAKAHAQQVKVFISIGGWSIGDGGGEDGRFHRMAETAKGRANFNKAIIKLVEEMNFDGVDLDWEYPDPNHRSAEDYVLLCRDLFGALHAKNKALSSAVVSSGKQAFGIKEDVYAYMDWINIMVYDGDYAPKELKHHSPYSMAKECIDFWLNERHLPADKCVLGLPFYAKKGFGNFGYSYKQLLQAGASPYDDYWNGQFYNGILTIENKCKLALSKKLAGVMVWEMKHDTNDEFSLFRTIHLTVADH